MSGGRVTMCTWAAAWQAVSAASPVIMTSWWQEARSIRSAGSESALSGDRKTANPANASPASAASRARWRSPPTVVSSGRRFTASASTRPPAAACRL
jgi:hypothetical protein